MAIRWLRKLPEALLALFGLLVFGWFGSQSISAILVVPLSISILAGIHLVAPQGRPTQIGLGIAYIVGGLVAGFLVLGFMIPGGSPDAYAAFARRATPLLGLYAVAVISLVVKIRVPQRWS